MEMNLDTLRAITDAEMRQAVGYWSGKLANMRQQAMYYYLGEAIGDLSPPEVEGRSSVVAPVVRNTIESMLPQLMVKFAGSDHPVEFEANKPGDEEKAAQATDYVSYIYHVKNNGEAVTYTWMKDALLQKNGIVKVWWDTRAEEKREEYVGLDQIELAQLMDEDDLEIIEQKQYADEEDAENRKQAIEQLTAQLQQAMQAAQQNPQAAQAAQQLQVQIQQIQSAPPKMLWDVVCKRMLDKQGRVCVENVPPEEFLISRKAKSIQDAPFVGHRVSRTYSELKSMGYKNVDNIGGDDAAASLNAERIERLGWDDEYAALNVNADTNMDDSQRRVWVTECYVRVDYDGDGIAELRKVVRAGNQVLENEIVDCAPFVSICPIPLPHKFFGLSVADLAMVGQKVETSLLRGVLDNTYMEVNGRYFAVDGQVNLDDLSVSRPGGIVRVKQQGAVGRLDQAQGNSGLGLQMLEYMKGFNEDSTGWTRYNQGSDGDSLNQTATGVNQITNRADMRLDLIARNFAVGFRELFRMILKLVSQYQQKEAVIKLRGEWVQVNPREWKNGFEATINVGLGTGSKDQLVAQLSMLAQHQANVYPLGVASNENIYQLMKELAKATGFKSADKFFTDPAKQPPQPPKPDPETVKAQAQMQIEQMKAQLQAQTDAAAKDKELALERERMQMQAQVDTHRQQVEAQQQQLKMQQERELEQVKLEASMQLEQFKAQMERETQLAVAKMKAEADLIKAQVAAQAQITSQQDNAADAALNDADDA